MEPYIGRVWVGLLVSAVAVVVATQVGALAPVQVGEGETPFRTALAQLGILYIVALFVERSLEVFVKALRQGQKALLQQEVNSTKDAAKAKAETVLLKYKAGTQRLALLVGLTLGMMVSLSGVRILGAIFEVAEAWAPLQKTVFHFTDVVITAGLIGGGSATIHELMALVDRFLRKTREQA